jgi:hypothetical protein
MGVFARNLSIAVCLLVVPALPARAAEWGPFVEKVIEHLRHHMTKEAADWAIRRVIQGDKTPTLQLTDEQIRQKIDDYIASCVARAKWLDDNKDRRSLSNTPLTSPEFSRELTAYRARCDQGP